MVERPALSRRRYIVASAASLILFLIVYGGAYFYYSEQISQGEAGRAISKLRAALWITPPFMFIGVFLFFRDLKKYK
jgi:TRAP-type C4-dicarboxylate transport system permease small subunit